MKTITDRIVEEKEQAKALAINLAETWAKLMLENYIEPTRKGTPKGDTIGFPKKKYHASLLMVLYPNSLRVKEIADLVGVSHDVLRSWRTEKQFKEAISEAHKSLGNIIAEEINSILREKEINLLKLQDNDSIGTTIGDTLKVLKSKNKTFDGKRTYADIIMKRSKGRIKKIVEIDDEKQIKHTIKFKGVKDLTDLSKFLLKALPFFNVAVIGPIIKSINKNVDDAITTSASLGLFMLQVFAVHDEKSLRQWTANEGKEVTKIIIESYIDTLVDPKAWEELGAEKIKEEAKALKEMIFSTIDILAG